MKKFPKLLLSAGLLLSLQLTAQDGNSCAAAIPITVGSGASSITLATGTTKWLACPSANFSIRFLKTSNPNLKFKKAQTYTPNCASLAVLKTDSNPQIDSSFTIRDINAASFIKIECIGNENQNIKLEILPFASFTTCGTNFCELIDNGGFDNLSPCISSCIANSAYSCPTAAYPCSTAVGLSITGEPFSLGLVPGWNRENGTPQINYNGTNAYAYMWSCNTNHEVITNKICRSVNNGESYRLKLDYAYELYPQVNCAPSGLKVDRLYAKFFNLLTGNSQTILLVSNISNTGWLNYNQVVNVLGGPYDRISIYPNNDVSNIVSAIKIDNVSLQDISNTICCTAPTYTIPQNTVVLYSSLTTATSLTGTIFEVQDNATLIIDKPVTFGTCKFRMGKEAGVNTNITTGTNQTITFNSCNFFSCGAYMSEGIRINNTNTINFNGCTIEDARFGISYLANANLSLVSNTFNKNYIGVYLPLSGTPENSIAQIPITFNNNSFTSNGSLMSPTNIFKLVKPLNSTTFITPVRGFSGIYGQGLANNSITVKIGETTSNSAGNTFVNLDIGIYLNRIWAEIFNNTFNTIDGKGIEATGLFNTIVAYGNLLSIGNTGLNQANRFNNNHTGINLGAGYSNVNIIGNQFNGSLFNNNVFGINASVNNMSAMNINNNTSNYYISFFQNSIPALPIVTGTNVTISVKNNSISNASAPIFVALNGAVNTTAFAYNIADNIITASGNGIFTSNMAKCLVINNNDVILPNFIGVGGFSEGISLSGGCDNAIVTLNKIKSDAVAIGNVTNPDMYGIRVLQSAMTIIQCNDLSLLGTCLGFEGSCLTTSQGVEGNKIKSGVYGFRLVNSGRIGTQGSATNRNTNSWGAAATGFPGATRFQTFVENTANVGSLTGGSVLYLGLPAYPTDNGFIGGFGVTPYSTTIGGPSIRQGGNGSGVFSCPVGPSGGGGTGITTAARIIDVGTPIANNTATFGSFSADNKLRAKQQLYQLIEDEPAAKTNITINTFYTTEQNSSIGKLKQVEAAIAVQDYPSAITLNNSITPITNTEISEKEYYQLYLKWISDASNFSVQDKNDLLVLANRCLQKRGSVIIKARNLYDLITNTKNTYSNTCASTTNSKVLNAFTYDGNDDSPIEVSNTAINKLNSITIAPNPNNGTFTINFEQRLETTIFIKLMNSRGYIVYEKTNAINANSFELNLQSLSNGIYYIMLSDNNTLNVKEKLVILKNE